MNIEEKSILILLKSAITGDKFELPGEFTLKSENVRSIVKKHHLATMVYAGAINCGISSEEPSMKSLFTLYYKCAVKSIKQMMLAETVFNLFEENGIDYLPTKGCNMKALYPKPELRLMGDVDITIRKEQLDLIDKVLSSNGFTKTLVRDVNITWEKDGLNMELHMIMNSFYRQEYYDDVWSRIQPVTKHRYAFTTEDAFIHIFNHFARHYRLGGVGLRHIMDLYVYRMKNPSMNEGYIYQEMCTLKLQEFYKNILDLLDVWFNDGEETLATKQLAETILKSGSWGDVASFVLSEEVTKANKRGEVSSSKRRAVVQSLFPPKDFMAINYKIVNKYPFLLPVMWVVRGVEVLVKRPKNVLPKVVALQEIEDKTVSEKQNQFKLVGLDIED